MCGLRHSVLIDEGVAIPLTTVDINSWRSYPVLIIARNQVISNPTDDNLLLVFSFFLSIVSKQIRNFFHTPIAIALFIFYE